jgi:multiple sugar transport system substrate-binding protein
MDQAGDGWPDVVFSTQQNDAIWASKETPNGEQGFAAPLNKGFLDDDFLDGFIPGANDITTIDGTQYGLRNDLAQTAATSSAAWATRS